MLAIRIIVCLSVEIPLHMLAIYFMCTSNSKTVSVLLNRLLIKHLKIQIKQPSLFRLARTCLEASKASSVLIELTAGFPDCVAWLLSCAMNNILTLKERVQILGPRWHHSR